MVNTAAISASQHQPSQQHRALKEVLDGSEANPHGKGSTPSKSTTKSISALFSSMAETEQYLSFESATASSTALRLNRPSPSAHRVGELDFVEVFGRLGLLFGNCGDVSEASGCRFFLRMLTTST
jgi:hypothetical protein